MIKITTFLLLLLSCTTVVLSTNQNLTTFHMTPLQQNCHTTVDINRFTQLLSNHLLLDHFDKAYSQLSRKISFQFRDSIGLRVRKLKKSTTTTTTTITNIPIDVQILKRQIRGAVGSFVEDKLPSILTHRYNTTSLQVQIDHLLYQHCPNILKLNDFNSISTQHCLLDNREIFLYQIHEFISNELQSTLFHVNQYDLPRLYEKARAQITSILTHFNLHLINEQHYKLELKLKKQHTSTSTHNRMNWITNEMISDFISTVYHTDDEDEKSSIKHFLELSI